MSRLGSFSPTVNPDNRFDFLPCDTNGDEIIIGASCTHQFEFPFRYSAYVKSGKIIYKQGLEVILEIDITSSMVTETTSGISKSIITLDLTPSQTQLFSTTLLDTYCQVRLVTNSDKVMYDEPHYIKIITPLKVEYSVGDDE